MKYAHQFISKETCNIHVDLKERSIKWDSDNVYVKVRTMPLKEEMNG